MDKRGCSNAKQRAPKATFGLFLFYEASEEAKRVVGMMTVNG